MMMNRLFALLFYVLRKFKKQNCLVFNTHYTLVALEQTKVVRPCSSNTPIRDDGLTKTYRRSSSLVLSLLRFSGPMNVALEQTKVIRHFVKYAHP
jgi:hypothetical protein